MKLPRALESNSLQITIAVAYSLLVMFTVVFLGTTALVLTRDALWETSTTYTRQLLGQVQTGIGNYLDEMDAIATAVLGNEDVRALLDDPGSRDRRTEARSLLTTIAGMRPDISLIALVTGDGNVLLHTADAPLNPAVRVASEPWFVRARSEGGAAVYSGARVQNLIRDRYRWVVTLSRARGEDVLVVDLNFRVIEQLARGVDLGPRGYLFMTDADGSIIYHPQQQLIYSDLVSEPIDELIRLGQSELVTGSGQDQRLYLAETLPETGWRVVAVNAVDQLLASQRQLRSYYLAWVALCFAIVMVLTVVLSRRISLPLQRLRQSMRAVEQGRFDLDIRVDRRDEIGALGRDFAIMVATVRDLMARNEREQEEKRSAEIRALQQQITPHFLYNTLDSIVWMAEGGRVDEVIDMTTNLARLLRLSIGRGEATASLEAELRHVESYLTIQQMRYRDRLSFRIDADPATLGVQLPRLTLQPIVENAIYHGIKNRESGGTVSLRSMQLDDEVRIVVHDDGPGVDPAVLERLQRHEVEPSGGVGLKNVHRRLELRYGPGYGVDISSSARHGTSVMIRVPREES